MWVGSFKLNVDVAVDVKDGCRGVGILVCDSNSNLLRAVAIVAPGMVSVLATELYVMKCKSKKSVWRWRDALVSDVRQLLASNPQITVEYLPHHANKVAQRITQFSLRHRGLSF
ncbi:hypothetical protein GBA52_014079 [Prunus armeniaca]|nr:hypothetical protein GBA52_014079 [Prunus armeniaca]